jgi:small subunit ribosomal protein S6
VTEYEILLMLDPEVPEERHAEIVARARELVEGSGGRWDGEDSWGRRKLAYEIRHKAEGTYYLLTFTAEPAALDEVSRVLKITDGVMRHMAVRRPQAPKERPAETGPAEPVATMPDARQDQQEEARPVA